MATVFLIYIVECFCFLHSSTEELEMRVSDEDLQVNEVCASEKCLKSCYSEVSWDGRLRRRATMEGYDGDDYNSRFIIFTNEFFLSSRNVSCVIHV